MLVTTEPLYSPLFHHLIRRGPRAHVPVPASSASLGLLLIVPHEGDAIVIFCTVTIALALGPFLIFRLRWYPAGPVDFTIEDVMIFGQLFLPSVSLTSLYCLCRGKGGHKDALHLLITIKSNKTSPQMDE